MIGNYDFDCLWGGSLEIEPSGNNAFRVGYRAGDRVCATIVTVINQDGGWRIDGLRPAK